MMSQNKPGIIRGGKERGVRSPVVLTFSNQTYKHILLPLWVCSYLYKSKRYHFLVNGQTGKIYGKKPVSALKVTLVVLLVILVVIGLVLAVNNGQ